MGLCVTPLAGAGGARAPAGGGSLVSAVDVGRCSACGAYVCHEATLEPEGWACALCDELNPYARSGGWRYMPPGEGEHDGAWPPPELLLGPLDCPAGGDAALDLECRPLVIAVLDRAGPEAGVAAACSALAAGIEVLPRDTLFGLVTYGDVGQASGCCVACMSRAWCRFFRGAWGGWGRTQAPKGVVGPELQEALTGQRPSAPRALNARDPSPAAGA